MRKRQVPLSVKEGSQVFIDKRLGLGLGWDWRLGSGTGIGDWDRGLGLGTGIGDWDWGLGLGTGDGKWGWLELGIPGDDSIIHQATHHPQLLTLKVSSDKKVP